MEERSLGSPPETTLGTARLRLGRSTVVSPLVCGGKPKRIELD